MIDMNETTIERKRVQISFIGDNGLAEQAHRDECDIHKIMKKAERTGMVEHLAMHQPSYSELPVPSDYHSMMNRVAEAKSTFESLPSTMREKFRHDPHNFLEFLTSEANRDEMIALGFGDAHLPPLPAVPDSLSPSDE